LNLGTNAVRAIGEKSGNLFVGIEEIEVDDAVSTEFPNLPKGKAFLLVVRDTGCGMDERTVQRIYDPFFSSWERSTGTGLGLSVVHGIVNSCNGVISVSSTPGEGSEFSIYLPKICASAVKVEDEQSTVRGGNEHILLVDDEEEVAGVYEKILNTLGYSVSVEFDGISALKLFESDPSKYDLVITDQTMPGLSGLRLSRRLLALRPDIPILIMSGFIEKLDPEVLREVGIKHLLSKPVRARDLAKTIRQVLDR
jgi:CheY-like chemotaxis protein